MVCGERYIQELKELHSHRYPWHSGRSYYFKENEILGYPYSEKVVNSLRALESWDTTNFTPKRVLICSSREQTNHFKLQEQLARLDLELKHIVNSGFGDWDDYTQIEEALLLGKHFRPIVDFFDKEGA